MSVDRRGSDSASGPVGEPDEVYRSTHRGGGNRAVHHDPACPALWSTPVDSIKARAPSVWPVEMIDRCRRCCWTDVDPVFKKRWVERKYLVGGWSIEDVADALDEYPSTVWRRMAKWEIETRGCDERPNSDGPHNDPGWLRRRYVYDRKTTEEIAEECGVSDPTISRRLGEFGIESRNRFESPS